MSSPVGPKKKDHKSTLDELMKAYESEEKKNKKNPPTKLPPAKMDYLLGIIEEKEPKPIKDKS